jgi:16S rRNA (cytosine1402-N4)-methyltransferase
MEIIHTPVLLDEVIQYLAPRGKNEIMVDATMGEGGHSYEMLSRFPDLFIVGIDADRAIQEIARERLAEFGSRVQFFHGWSQDFFAAYPAGLGRPDTVLVDLGISAYHYSEKSGRGFSFSREEPLDMRLDPAQGISAAELLARMPENEIADILYRNAEERYSRRIARAIVSQRRQGAIASSAALAELVERAVPASYRHGPIHPATRVFLAVRAEINGELSRLPDLLEGALGVLKPQGRLGVISFHSLEDRLIKHFFKTKSMDCTCPPQAPTCNCTGRTVKILSGKGVTPSEEEKRRNPPSRSARLRVAEKINGGSANGVLGVQEK